MIGETIDSRYRVESLLGRGGMGAVYHATDLVEKRPVALKVLHFFLDTGTEAAHVRFQREFRVLARLEHPHIMKAYTFGTHNDIPYLTLEFLQGKTLSDLMANGSLQRSQSLHIARQLGEALIHLHAKSIVHRDLKPGNLMLLPPDDAPYLKLMDFGLVRQSNLSQQLTEEGVALGTVAYMAPEQAQGVPVDFRVDLYALGIILYEMVTGRLPFVDDNPAMLLMQQLVASPPPPSQFKSDVDEGLEQLIMELLAKEPAERPHSTDLLVKRLAELANETAPVLAPPPNQAGMIPRVPLIGRQVSIDELTQHWHQAKQGRGQVIFLAGAAGAGKSRLLTEASLQVKLGQGRFLSCRCRESAALPYQPFVDVLEKLLRDLPAAATEALPAELSLLIPDGRDEMSGQQNVTDQAEFQRRLFAAYWNVVLQASQSQPLMLVIEDGQWADPATADLLSYLAHRVDQAPILFVLSYRPEEVKVETALARLQRDMGHGQQAQRITLDLLSREQVAEFLGTALGKDDVPEVVVDRFHQATNGNPLFIEETLKALAAEGQVADWLHETSHSQWGGQSEAALKLPQNVLSLAERRLQILSEDDRSLMVRAAVLGSEFTFSLLEAVTQLDEDSLLDALERILAARLIEELPLDKGDDRFRFAQEALRQALLGTITGRRRRRLHQRTAEAIETLYDTSQPRYWPALAYHYLAAEAGQQALQYTILVGDEAGRLYASAEAIDYYTRALELARRDDAADGQLIHLFSQRGRMLELRNEYDEAMANYKEMEAEAVRRGDQALKLASLVALGTVYSSHPTLLDPEKGRVACDQALQLARELGDRKGEAKALWNLLLLYRFDLSQPQKAVEYGEAALAIARELELAEQQAFILNDLQYAYIMLADLGRARMMSDDALGCWRNLGNLPMLSDNLKASALIYFMSGDHAAAIEAAQEGYQVAQSIENFYNQIAIKEHIAYAYRELGEFEMMVRGLKEAIDLDHHASSGMGTLAEAGLALAYSEVGLIENGLASLRRAFDNVDVLPPVFHFRDYLYAIQVQLHLLQGDLSAAEAALDEVQFDASKYTNLLPLSNFVIPVVASEISLKLGVYDQVNKVADAFIAHRTEAGARVGLADFHYLKGRVALAKDELEEARGNLIQAWIVAEASSARRIWWQVLVTLAEVEERLSDETTAAALRLEARTILDYIIEQIPEGEMRDSFVALPAVTELQSGSP